MTKVRQGEQPGRDRRRAMTPARSRRIHQAWAGLCCLCREPVEESGPGVIYEHIGVLWITGSDADEDIGPAHAECAARKTGGKRGDLSTVAKIKRLQKKHAGEKKAGGRKLEGRGFDKTKTRGFGGKVRPRKPKRGRDG